jgi:NADP-dependent 3-hydroxy acid dehydrogenase YdfG
VVKEIAQLYSGKAITSNHNVISGGEIIKLALKEFGRVDIVVNNAGNLIDKSFHKLSKEDWKSVLDVHLQG